MSNGPLLFFGILVTLASSFWGLILAPQLQFGRQQPRLIEATGEYYPPARPGLAEKGAGVYRSLGCVECHSQQVRQTGVHFDVWVTDLTTNLQTVAPAVARIQSSLTEVDASQLFARLPARIAAGMKPTEAQDLATRLTEAGAKAQTALVVLGPDIERRWGLRMSVAQDYLRDYPVQLGQLRLGPDLAGYGSRQTNINAVLRHLYQSPVPRSMMPPFRFLFQKRVYGDGETIPTGAIILTPAGRDKPGEMLIPSETATALAAYLVSLKAEASLFEAPVGKIPVATVSAPAAPAPPVPAP